MSAAILGIALLASGTSAARGAATAPSGNAVASKVFTSSNPHATFSALSTADKAAFLRFETPSKTSVSMTITSPGRLAGRHVESVRDAARAAGAVAFNGCLTVVVNGKVKAAAGNTLYTFWQATIVCSSGGHVRSVAVPANRTGGETSTPGWRIDKAPTRTTLSVGWEGRGVAQYHFVLGVAGWDVQHPTDCLQARGNADGVHYTSSYSCNIN